MLLVNVCMRINLAVVEYFALYRGLEIMQQLNVAQSQDNTQLILYSFNVDRLFSPSTVLSI